MDEDLEHIDCAIKDHVAKSIRIGKTTDGKYDVAELKRIRTRTGCDLETAKIVSDEKKNLLEALRVVNQYFEAQGIIAGDYLPPMHPALFVQSALDKERG